MRLFQETSLSKELDFNDFYLLNRYKYRCLGASFLFLPQIAQS